MFAQYWHELVLLTFTVGEHCVGDGIKMGKNVLKKSGSSYKQQGEGTSHLYRLVVKPDNTVQVEIDEEKIYEGSLKENWEVLKPKEIPDPDDKMPSDWADDSMRDDSEEELIEALRP